MSELDILKQPLQPPSRLEDLSGEYVNVECLNTMREILHKYKVRLDGKRGVVVLILDQFNKLRPRESKPIFSHLEGYNALRLGAGLIAAWADWCEADRGFALQTVDMEVSRMRKKRWSEK